MGKGPVQIVVLCEGRQDACFIRKFLVRRGIRPDRIRVSYSPDGSGEQYVRNKFATELVEYRKSHVARALIVATDADVMAVQDRIETLKNACRSARIQFRVQNERIALIIPKRNIETWFAYLRGDSIQENTRDKYFYGKYTFESECLPDAAKLDVMCRRGSLDDNPPPSLEAACVEFQRLGI